MYVNANGNVVCVCTITSMPVYLEESGEKKVELTRMAAKCIESSPEGTQTVFMSVLFYTVLAIPAKALKPGDVIVVLGREMSKEKVQWGRHKLDRTVIVDFWIPRWIDPLGLIMNLQIRRDVALKAREYKEMIAEYLTECKPAIVQWVAEYFKSMKDTIIQWVIDAFKAMKANNSNKKDGE